MRCTRGRSEAGRLAGKLWFGEPYEARRWVSLDVGLATKYRHTALEVTFGGEDRDLGLHVGLWFVSLWLGLAIVPRSWRQRSYAWAQRRAAVLGPGVYASEIDPFDGRTTGIRIFDGSVWLDVWRNDVGWRAEDTPRLERCRTEPGGPRRWRFVRGHLPWNGWGWSWTLHVTDWLLGASRLEVDADWTRETASVVRMPEGDYHCLVRVERCRWGRRWWRGRWVYRANVEVPLGVPFAGKGENSWDCGDDGLYGTSFAVEDEPPEAFEVCDRVALSVLKTRQRRGGLQWKPQQGFRVLPPDLRPDLAVLRDLLMSTGWSEDDSNALVQHADDNTDVGGLCRRAWDENAHPQIRRLLEVAARFRPVVEVPA